MRERAEYKWMLPLSDLIYRTRLTRPKHILTHIQRARTLRARARADWTNLVWHFCFASFAFLWPSVGRIPCAHAYGPAISISFDISPMCSRPNVQIHVPYVSVRVIETTTAVENRQKKKNLIFSHDFSWRMHTQTSSCRLYSAWWFLFVYVCMMRFCLGLYSVAACSSAQTEPPPNNSESMRLFSEIEPMSQRLRQKSKATFHKRFRKTGRATDANNNNNQGRILCTRTLDAHKKWRYADGV